MSGRVWVVVENGMEYTDIKRVYLDQAAAEAFVEANNKTTRSLNLDIEEHPIGAPDVAYDGPVYECQWITRRKLAGEKQLLLVREDGFTMVVPSAVPTSSGYRYQEYFAGPSWSTVEPRYEEPPVWIDSFYDGSDWHTGEAPPAAEVTDRSDTRVVVRGTDKAAVDALVREVAAQLKAGLP